MKQGNLIIQNVTGLHARPARLFVDAAKKFTASVQIKHAGRSANGKSMISMLTLGVECGAEITMLVDGSDEVGAYAALEKLIQEGFGETLVNKNTATQNGAITATVSAAPAVLAPPTALPLPTSASHLLEGVIAAPGIAIGGVFKLQETTVALAAFSGDVDAEQHALRNAILQAGNQLTQLRNQLIASGVSNEAAIFDAHQEIITDPDLISEVMTQIAAQQSAATAWKWVTDKHAAAVRQLSDPLLAARAADIQDVGKRVLMLLSGQSKNIDLPDTPVILLAKELSPSDMAAIDRNKVIGICIAEGGPTAHASILARSLGIPAIVSANAKLHALPNGTRIILNANGAGRSGTIDLCPTPAALAEAEAAQQAWQARRQRATQAAHAPAITLDGHRVEVVANIGSVADAKAAFAAGAEGVGLLRTEFLFMDSTIAPSEQTQFEAYRDILQAMADTPVIIRTLDIGGDKPVAYLDMPVEKNPFLGERGIRLCLNRPDILRTQLRAILRAAEFGCARIMIPMIADFAEWRAVRAMLTELQTELNAPAVALGIMIEVPSAAVMADIFAPEVAFFSIGTNDLTQYVLAMDRQHPSLASKADGLHPAVLRLIAQTVEAAHKAGKWVGVCGELGADLQALPILVGLGVDELSVNSAAIGLVKANVRELRLSDAKALAYRALACATAADVRKLTI